MDTTKIDGYESMTPEEKVAALEAYEFDMSGFVKKELYDRAASDAAEWKRKHHSLLSEADQARVVAEEAQQATMARLAELERKDKISTTRDQYLTSGFSAKLALETAEAFVDGRMDVVLANITKHAAEVATAAQDRALKGTPTPPGGGNPNPGHMNYDAEIAKAMEAGDYVRAAQLSRLQAEQK